MPGFFDRLFRRSQSQRTMYDEFLELATPLVVSGYRRVAAERGCAPGPGISDAEIIQIYQEVGTAFQGAARAQGEILPDAIVNNIVLFFLQKYQMFGQTNRQFFIEHVAYEVHKYKKEGLREDYRKELNLFDQPDEPPLWHKKVPEPLQYSNPQLIKNLEELRQEFGFDHQTFNGALMTSKNMIWRSVLWAYRETRRGLPGLSDQEYFAMVLVNWVSNKILLLPVNTSPTAWSADQLKKIIDDAEHFVRPCKKIDDVYHVIVQIEDSEGTFSDPLGVISRIDSVFAGTLQ
jgi:hypothetical protein